MTTSQHPHHPTLAPAYDLLARLEQTLPRIDRRLATAADHLGDAAQLLEALPLGTGDFAATRSRLLNALRYLDQAEWGAARYEIELTLRGLRTFIQRFAAAPASA